MASPGAPLPPSAALFARVDFLLDEEGEGGGLRLLEVELIEPCLYLRQGGAGAVAALADALERALAEGDAQ